MSRITVLGSLNMDFVVSVERLPAPGETVSGRDFQMLPGGKGANQACAAGKLGGPSVSTRMIGRVGNDVFGDHLKASLADAGVDAREVRVTAAQPTGVAFIWVDRSGQNSIVVSPGANQTLGPDEVSAMDAPFQGSRFAMFQLETPIDAVSTALKQARSQGAETILDPAPVQRLSAEMLANVDILTPNENEALLLLGLPPGRLAPTDASNLARSLRNLGPRRIALKMGEQGCLYFDGEREIVSRGFKVDVKDTTAAGDTFNGGLAVALAEGMPIEVALRFANASAALSVTRVGAQASIPTRAEVDAFLATV